MGRYKIEDRWTRKLTPVGRGRSVSVTVPIEFIRELKWRDHQKVTLKKIGKKIVIEDWKG